VGTFTALDSPRLTLLTLFQPGLPNGYSQTFFAGIERRIGK